MAYNLSIKSFVLFYLCVPSAPAKNVERNLPPYFFLEFFQEKALFFSNDKNVNVTVFVVFTLRQGPKEDDRGNVSHALSQEAEQPALHNRSYVKRDLQAPKE